MSGCTWILTISILSVCVGEKKHAAGSAVAAEKVMNLKKKEKERKSIGSFRTWGVGKGKMTFYCSGISGP